MGRFLHDLHAFSLADWDDLGRDFGTSPCKFDGRFFLHIVPQQVWRMFHVTNDFFPFFSPIFMFEAWGKSPKDVMFQIV